MWWAKWRWGPFTNYCLLKPGKYINGLDRWSLWCWGNNICWNAETHYVYYYARARVSLTEPMSYALISKVSAGKHRKTKMLSQVKYHDLFCVVRWWCIIFWFRLKLKYILYNTWVYRVYVCCLLSGFIPLYFQVCIWNSICPLKYASSRKWILYNNMLRGHNLLAADLFSLVKYEVTICCGSYLKRAYFIIWMQSARSRTQKLPGVWVKLETCWIMCCWPYGALSSSQLGGPDWCFRSQNGLLTMYRRIHYGLIPFLAYLRSSHLSLAAVPS